MRVGIVGAGRIAGNAARLLAPAGHDVLVSFSRDPAKLRALADGIDERAAAGPPSQAVRHGDVVMLSVPWTAIDEPLAAAGPLDGKIVIDTTNQFGRNGLEQLPEGTSAAEVNAERMPGARLVKCFNTLTAGFQAEAAERREADRVAMFLAGEDAEAKRVVARLIADCRFEPVDVGGWSEVWIMEAPRRPGAVYGEEYRASEARLIAEAVKTEPERARELAQELKVRY